MKGNELQGNARNCKEMQGIARKCKDLQGNSRNCKEKQGIARNFVIDHFEMSISPRKDFSGSKLKLSDQDWICNSYDTS
jgi:hypothetical protein